MDKNTYKHFCTLHNLKDTHSWHTRKGSSSGEEVRESPVFVYQRPGSREQGGGANLISHSVQLKHALMPSLLLLLLLQDFLSHCSSPTLCFCVYACACACQRSSEEARGGGRPQERAPQEN